jgi:hypothetical protein
VTGNDLNVLVEDAHLIDVEAQLPGYPCAMFSERFVDPRLCEKAMSSSVLTTRTATGSRSRDDAAPLLGVGPWGGVHQPADVTTRRSPIARALRRVSIYAPIVYLRMARPPRSCLTSR